MESTRLLIAVCGVALLSQLPACVSNAPSLAGIHHANGWATAHGDVAGGSAAAASNRFFVRNRAELVRALDANQRAPKKSPEPLHITVVGEIDLSVDEQGATLSEADYRESSFSWSVYEQTFAPAVWGKALPEGPIEDARRRSAERQARTVVLRVSSNTTIIGERGARIKNGGLHIKDAENIVIQNINFEDAYDFFPKWDPKDNTNGEWNAEYDNVTINNARRVWIDRCTFSDGARPDKLNRSMFGRPMQFHDGLVDIIRGSDLVTISNSHFKNHDKGMLIGNSDSRQEDAGKLRVTLHHNWFENVSERSPRVRYGSVHVYNNLYTASADADYRHGYFIGIGVQSQVFSQANAFEVGAVIAGRPYKLWRGDRLREQDNILNGGPHEGLSSLRKEYPSVAISNQIDWAPPAGGPIDVVSRVAFLVRNQSGAR